MVSVVFSLPKKVVKKKFHKFAAYRGKGRRFPFPFRRRIRSYKFLFFSRTKLLKSYLRSSRSNPAFRRSFFFSSLFLSFSHRRLSASFKPYRFFHLVHPTYSIPFNPFFYLRYPRAPKRSKRFWFRYLRIFNNSSHRTLASRRLVGFRSPKLRILFPSVFRRIRFSSARSSWFQFYKVSKKKKGWLFTIRHGLTFLRPSGENVHYDRKAKRFRLKKKRPWFKVWPFRYGISKKLFKKQWRRPPWFGRLVKWWGEVPEFPLYWKLHKKRTHRPVVQARIIVKRTWSNFFFTLVSVTGRVLASFSTGSLGFKGKHRTTPLAISSAAHRIGVAALLRNVRNLALTFYSLGPRFHLSSAVRVFGEFRKKKHLRFRYLQEEVSLPHSLPKRPKRSRKVLAFPHTGDTPVWCNG